MVASSQHLYSPLSSLERNFSHSPLVLHSGSSRRDSGCPGLACVHSPHWNSHCYWGVKCCDFGQIGPDTHRWPEREGASVREWQLFLWTVWPEKDQAGEQFPWLPRPGVLGA